MKKFLIRMLMIVVVLAMTFVAACNSSAAISKAECDALADRTEILSKALYTADASRARLYELSHDLGGVADDYADILIDFILEDYFTYTDPTIVIRFNKEHVQHHCYGAMDLSHE